MGLDRHSRGTLGRLRAGEQLDYDVGIQQPGGHRLNARVIWSASPRRPSRMACPTVSPSSGCRGLTSSRRSFSDVGRGSSCLSLTDHLDHEVVPDLDA